MPIIMKGVTGYGALPAGPLCWTLPKTCPHKWAMALAAMGWPGDAPVGMIRFMSGFPCLPAKLPESPDLRTEQSAALAA
jgi:hypothetical protein